MKCVYAFAALLFLVQTPNLEAQEDDSDWIQLAGKSLRTVWQGNPQEWEVAGDAELDSENPANLLAKPGVGVLISRVPEDSEDGNLATHQLFSDVEAHIEFLVPQGSNAGVKFQGLYEIQIRDSHGKEKADANDCGGIYPRAEVEPQYHLIDEGIPPNTNAALSAGAWQTLDVVFHAPHFDSQGNKTQNARFVKVVLNGKLIHEDVELKWPTGHAWRTKPEVAEGPLFLQGDHGPIAYRNVRVKPLPRPADGLKITSDIVYGHKMGMALTFDVFEPIVEPNDAGVLFMVSGGWYSRWRPPEDLMKLVKPLTDKGFTVFAVRHGSSPKFSIPEAVEDVRRSVRYIRKHVARYHIDPDRLGVFGMSAGGHLSLVLGTASDEGDPEAKDPVLQESDRVNAVVALVPPSDLRIMVWEASEALPAYKNFPALNLPLEEAAEYSPLLHVSPDDPPTMVISGVKDKLVPIRHSHDIRAAYEEKGVTNELVLFEEAGHGFKGEEFEEAMTHLVGWFEEHLTEEDEEEE